MRIGKIERSDLQDGEGNILVGGSDGDIDVSSVAIADISGAANLAAPVKASLSSNANISITPPVCFLNRILASTTFVLLNTRVEPCGMYSEILRYESSVIFSSRQINNFEASLSSSG